MPNAIVLNAHRYFHCAGPGRLQLPALFPVVTGKNYVSIRLAWMVRVNGPVILRITRGGRRVCNCRMERSRVVLADDHAQFLDDVRDLLTVGFDVVRAVSDGSALVSAARECHPDVIVSDIDMPRLSGIAACRQVLQEGLAKGAVMLTMYNEPELVRSAQAAHILGYVLKVDAGEELIPAIESVIQGRSYLSRGIGKPALW